MNIGARLVVALIFIGLLAPRAVADSPPQPSGAIIVDGIELRDAGFVRMDGKIYLPLARMAEACGLSVKVEDGGTVVAGSLRFQATSMKVGNRVYVIRADVKRALDATVYVDEPNGRVVVLTPRGQKKAVKQGGTVVAASSRPPTAAEPASPSPPRTIYGNPNGGYAPQTGTPPPTGGPVKNGIPPGAAPQNGGAPYGDPSTGGGNPPPYLSLIHI